jgi:CTP synthase
MNEPFHEVTIAIVGKYVDLTESYKSLNEALIHGGIPNRCRVNLKFVDSETIDANTCNLSLEGVDGVLVPGGFGSRGVEGKVCAARYARENKIPYFGICLGMQIAVIEFARHVAGLDQANSTEFDPGTPHPVIYLMEEWFDDKSGIIQRRDIHSDKGGTMRLGAYPCKLATGTVAYRAYETEAISERHRHRYEFNNAYMESLKESGLEISGMAPSGELVEVVEIAEHPWYLGCQFHPEFKSRPMTPHPLFRSFIAAALHYSGDRKIDNHAVA